MQGGVTPILTVLRSATAVKVKGQWARLILDEEQRLNCFPKAVKASRVSSARKYSGNRSTVKTNFRQKSTVKVENRS